jgi:GNAT superfamily N-acetyltransferase
MSDHHACRSGAGSLTAGRAVLLGLALTLLQLGAVLLVTGRPLRDAYRSLSQWDSKWYARLAEHGYPERMPDRREDMPTVGFFPGYPLAARLVMTLTGLPAPLALPVVAQLACWGFWVYLLLLLGRWQTPLPVAAGCVALVLAHPAAFYLVAGYSESLFLVGVLGFLYWQDVRCPWGWPLAALHGILLTATRIVGIPLVAVPLAVATLDLRRSREPDHRRKWVAAALLGGVAMLGGLSFFAYCRVHFGRWDAYLYAQEHGWNVKPDYLAFFRIETYRIDVPELTEFAVNPNWVSRVFGQLTFVAFLALALVEVRAAKDDAGRWRQRLALYLSAWLMFFVAVTGLTNLRLVSMVRYSFCVHVLLILAVAHLLSSPTRVPVRRPRAIVALAVLVVGSVLLQACLLRLYTSGQWVS